VLGETYSYQDQTLYCEQVALEDIASRAGTPCYVYSARSILDRFASYQDAFGQTPHSICYAVKANSTLEILRILARAGAGFDVVSGGELFRVLKAGGNASKVVFSGVGKTAQEIEYAVEQDIHCFNCESEAELSLINSIAARHRRIARVAFRVNPDIDAATHPYISTGLRQHKFGIDIAEAGQFYERASKLSNIAAETLSCHIGSQLLDTAPILKAVDRMLALVESLRAAGAPIHHLDLGGGLGVAYQESETAPLIPGFIQQVCDRAKSHHLVLHIEPGRSIVGASGVLLTRVLYRKSNADKEFIIVDAAMNDLLRPALYKAHHDIVPLRKSPHLGEIVADVVGPVCESGDFLALNRRMANSMPGDLLAVCTAGAYGFVLASNYNTRPRPPEVLVEGDQWRIIRQRETYDDLIKEEL